MSVSLVKNQPPEHPTSASSLWTCPRKPSMLSTSLSKGVCPQYQLFVGQHGDNIHFLVVDVVVSFSVFPLSEHNTTQPTVNSSSAKCWSAPCPVYGTTRVEVLTTFLMLRTATGRAFSAFLTSFDTFAGSLSRLPSGKTLAMATGRTVGSSSTGTAAISGCAGVAASKESGSTLATAMAGQRPRMGLMGSEAKIQWNLQLLLQIMDSNPNHLL